MGRHCQEKEKRSMYHTIEFGADFIVDLEVSPKHPLERMMIESGRRARTQVKPYVIETTEGPSRSCRSFFEDGVIRSVPFALFSFVEDGD